MIMYILIYCLLCLLIILVCTYYNYKFRFKYGAKGPTGDKGPRGLKGDKGLKGPRGRMGERGFYGPRGSNNGDQGDKGIVGYVGDKGSKGVRGYRGFEGKIGNIGERGMAGTKGRQGAPGLDGLPGDPGEYDITVVDEKSCKVMPFNKTTRTMKCPYNYVLTGIKNDPFNYEGTCCKLLINESCRGLPMARKLNKHKPEAVGTSIEYKYRTKEQQEKFDKLKTKYFYLGEGLIPLFDKDDYVCDEGSQPEIKGSTSLRCCKPEEKDPNLKYIKYF